MQLLFPLLNSNLESVEYALPSLEDGLSSVKLMYFKWYGNAIAGQTVEFGSFSVPSGYNFVGMLLTPHASLHISMSYLNNHIYAYSETYTGEVHYDVLMILQKV